MSFNKSDLHVGAPLVFTPRSSHRWDAAPSYSFGWTVERLTPTGKGVAVRAVSGSSGNEVQRKAFQNQGYETEGGNPNGKVASYGGTFHTDVAACQAVMDQFRRRQAAAEALNKVKLDSTAWHSWHKDSMLSEVAKLEALVAAARAAVEAI